MRAPSRRSAPVHQGIHAAGAADAGRAVGDGDRSTLHPPSSIAATSQRRRAAHDAPTVSPQRAWGRNPRSVRGPASAPFAETSHRVGDCWVGHVCGTPALTGLRPRMRDATETPGGARAASTSQRRRPSAVRPPDPTIPAAGPAPDRSSASPPSHVTPSARVAACPSDISVGDASDISIGDLHRTVAYRALWNFGQPTSLCNARPGARTAATCVDPA